MRRACLAVGVTLMFAACGGSSSTTGSNDGGGGSGGSGGIALADVPQALAQADCDLYTRCYGSITSVLAVGGEDCATRTQRSIEDGGFNELSSSVAAGTVKYHADLIPGCLDAIKKESCSDLLQRSIPACQSAVEGTVDAGGDCNTDTDCKGGTMFCSSTSGTCPGKCTALLGAGQDCTRDAVCQDGLTCDATTKKCVKPPALGEACGGGVKPDCAPPNLCIGQNKTQQTPGTCKTVEAVFATPAGASCDISNGPWCKNAAPCVASSFTPPSTFTAACGATVASGGACQLAIPDQCPSGEYCDITVAQATTGASGTCRPAPKSGEACAVPLTGAAGCAAYTRCDPTTNKCATLQHLGEPCNDDSICYSGRCANGGCAPSACGS